MPPSLRVLAVDDTALYRKILQDAVKRCRGADFVQACHSGASLLKRLEQDANVDVILLDVVMPELDGLETLKQVRSKYPRISVVMVSGATTRDAAVTVEALRLGALEFIAKPRTGTFEQSMVELTSQLERVFDIVRSKVYGKSIFVPETAKDTIYPPFKPKKADLGARRANPGEFHLCLIGVSTGGPNALAEVLPKLPISFPIPVLVVQHMPPFFTTSLAAHLNSRCELSVKEAPHGYHPKAGEILLAPGGRHLTVVPSVHGWETRLTDTPPVHSCRPSVDVLFKSVAQASLQPMLSVILTGMGNDGADGVKCLRIKSKKSICIAQDEATSVVYGMPRAVIERQYADEVLPLRDIGNRLVQLAGHARKHAMA